MLRPISLGCAILWILFIPFHLADLLPEFRTPVMVSDILMFLIPLVLYAALRLDAVSIRWTGPVVVSLASTNVVGVLVVYWLAGLDFQSFYIAIIIIASGSLILMTRWFLVSSAIALVAWAVVAIRHSSGSELANLGFLQAAAIMVGVTTHITRTRFTKRIFAYQQRDKGREAALQKLLAETESARRELDLRVAERTHELQGAYDDLRVQVEGGARLEAERRLLEAELHHAQRLESVGQLAGGIAHDFNNLLTVIGGNIDLVLELAETLDDAYRVCLEDARGAADRAAELTTELLAYSRKQPVVLATLQPVEIIRGMRSMIEQAATENIDLEVALGPIQSSVRAGRGQIEQVVMNLVLNACDAMPEGGKLKLELDEVDQCPVAPPSVGPARPFVRLRVSDTGCGMDEKTQERVFEPFFTTKELGKGTGLGLSVVHGIVKQHEGHLALESTPGKGSTFSVFLPCATEGESREAPGPSRRLHDPMATEPALTILLVEDEAAVRRFTKMLLEQLGHQVLIAESGTAALGVAKNFEGEIHLLLTDVLMPGIRGPELAGKLQSVRPATRVLYVSGYADPKAVEDLNLQVETAFLQKPFNLENLRTKIRELMAS
jgi:signal transduction histidine kinase/CheY-like chemotaxis protein